MNCGVGLRHGLDLALLWLWRRPAAVALIGPLAWEPPYAVGKGKKNPKNKKQLLIAVLLHLHFQEGINTEGTFLVLFQYHFITFSITLPFCYGNFQTYPKEV